jgi:hypothetical protein
MRRLGSAVLAVSLFAGCGGIDTEPSSEPSSSLEQQEAPLTTSDVDVAPECHGIINFANNATFMTLDLYLPSDVVTRMVNQRAVTPFTSLASVSAVYGMGPARLKQLEGGARAQGYIGASCVGIMDAIAVSTDDSAAMVSLVNSISSSELHDIMPDAWNGAEALLNSRPFTSAQAISDVAGVGDVSLRSIRNAATLSRPFEALIAALNAQTGNGSYGADMARHFDWWAEVKTGGGYGNWVECFGLEPRSTPYEASVRPYLADAAEVRAEVMNTLNYAGAINNIPASVVSAGLENLNALTAGRQFKGCYRSYSNDPWSSNSIAVFVDVETGFSVFTRTWWAE